MTTDIKLLDWDTHFFGHRIGRIHNTHLEADDFAMIDAQATHERFDCVYLLLDAKAIPVIHLAEAHDYHLYDIRVTFEQRLHKGLLIQHVVVPQTVKLRDAIKEDVTVLLPTARAAYIHSRFYNDPHFDDEKCGQLYEEWFRKSILTEYATGVRIAVLKDKPVAYTTYHIDEATQTAAIGLVGVAEESRGQHLGTFIIEDTLRVLVEAGIGQVTVVTQGSNIGAQRLYQRTGFVSKQTEVWFHKWFQHEAQY